VLFHVLHNTVILWKTATTATFIDPLDIPEEHHN